MLLVAWSIKSVLSLVIQAHSYINCSSLPLAAQLMRQFLHHIILFKTWRKKHSALTNSSETISKSIKYEETKSRSYTYLLLFSIYIPLHTRHQPNHKHATKLINYSPKKILRMLERKQMWEITWQKPWGTRRPQIWGLCRKPQRESIELIWRRKASK